MYLLGYDIGSSSVKAALADASTGQTLAVIKSPETEMEMLALQAGWAEQDPEMWWKNVCIATRKLLEQTKISPGDIKGIGISYQMHGLVLVDANQRVLRPSIIWCDSRAAAIGDRAFQEIGQEHCLSHYLNSPGNFTAAKLRWVKENEPDIYAKIDKFMLPGDYIAMRLTGEICTTASGLSEGVFWDFQTQSPAEGILGYYGFDVDLLPEIKPTFSHQGAVMQAAAEATGLAVGIPVNYRAGDQPNNALSLNVLEAGEVAATGGTSGVVYGVVDRPVYDQASRVNGFAHVNYTAETPNIGVLLCINGAGIQYSWMQKQVGGAALNYGEMEKMAASVPPGSDGLVLLPFGNGGERIFCNKMLGSQLCNLQLNRHQQPHLFRAALEGIAFSFIYGMKIMEEMGVDVQVIRAGDDNLFQSEVFASTISNTMGNSIEIIHTTGAVGAAKAAGVAAGIYTSVREAMQHTELVRTYTPENDRTPYLSAYDNWLGYLQQML